MKGVTLSYHSDGSESSTSSASKGNDWRSLKMEEGASNEQANIAKKMSAMKFKKAPQAPRRFKSAFIFFSAQKHREIREQMGENCITEKTTNIAKLVAKAWKDLSPHEREKWEMMSYRDKKRYEMEKSIYNGPWRVPASSRTPKDPTAPKRPMSAFLAFSNQRRGMVRQKNPEISSASISKTLARMWKDAPDYIRQKYIDEESAKRSQYKVAMSNWRQQNDNKKRAEKQQQEENVLRLAEESELQSRLSNARALLHQQIDPTALAVASYITNEGSNAAMNQPVQTFMDLRHLPVGERAHGVVPAYENSLTTSPIGQTLPLLGMGHLFPALQTPLQYQVNDCQSILNTRSFVQPFSLLTPNTGGLYGSLGPLLYRPALDGLNTSAPGHHHLFDGLGHPWNIGGNI